MCVCELCGTSVLMAIHVYTKLKVKMNVTVCQTVNEITDRLAEKF